MAQLVLVRHGQASALSADYDKLSERGHAQAKLLGKHWAARGTTFDRVYVGPRRRHRETYENVRDELGGQLPAATFIDELDEHHGMAVFFATMPKLVATRPDVAELAAGATRAGGQLRLFRGVMRLWVENHLAALHPSDAERYDTFIARVRRGLRVMTETAVKGERIVAFTSAGATAAAACLALGIEDGRAMDLSFEIVNASITTLRFSGEKLSLSTLNETPHLPEEMTTHV